MKQNGRPLTYVFISSDKFPPFRVDVAVLFGKRMAERGHRIHWLLQSDKPLKRGHLTRWAGGTVRVAANPDGGSVMVRLKQRLCDMLNDLRIFSILRKHPCDFILVKDKFLSGVTAMVASKLLNIKYIYWLSYPFPEDFLYQMREGLADHPLLYWIRGHALKILLYRLLLPFADHVFVQSEEMRNDVSGHGIKKEKMTPVVMGVPLEEIPFFGYEKAPDGPDQEKIVLYLGTLIRGRQLGFLVRAFAQVLKKEKQARLWFVGGGDDESDAQQLRDEARELGIEHTIVITGFLPRQEALQYVKNARVCVSPIYPTPVLKCSSPTKIIEYMAMGKAVVANDIPDQYRVISESRSGCCVPYCEDAFAEAILYLLNHPARAKAMGIRGREYIRRHRDYHRIADFVDTKLRTLCRYQGCK